MPRQRYLYRNGDWIEAEKAAPKHQAYLISDALPDVRHPTTGKIYTSKSRYYADTRAMGKEIMGNDMGSINTPRPTARSRLEHPGYTLARNFDKMGGR